MNRKKLLIGLAAAAALGVGWFLLRRGGSSTTLPSPATGTYPAVTTLVHTKILPADATLAGHVGPKAAAKLNSPEGDVYISPSKGVFYRVSKGGQLWLQSITGAQSLIAVVGEP